MNAMLPATSATPLDLHLPAFEGGLGKACACAHRFAPKAARVMQKCLIRQQYKYRTAVLRNAEVSDSTAVHTSTAVGDEEEQNETDAGRILDNRLSTRPYQVIGSRAYVNCNRY